MNSELIKSATRLSKLLEYFSELDKVHVYVEKDISLFIYNIYVTYNEFRGKEKMYCIDTKHYISYKKRYSDKASYNICFTAERALKNDIIIDKSEIFSKHLVKVIFKINQHSNMNKDKLSETIDDWSFVENNILRRRFDNYKKAHK